MVRIIQLLFVLIVAVPAALAGRTPMQPPGDLLLRQSTATIAATPLGTTRGYDAPTPRYSCPSQPREKAARHDFCNYDVFRRCFPEQFTAKLRDHESGLNLDYFGAMCRTGPRSLFVRVRSTL